MIVRGGGTRKAACTDILCSWNEANMKGVQPAPITEVNFYTEKAKDKLLSSGARARRAPPKPWSEVEKENFLVSLLAADSLPIALSLFR